MFVYCVLTPSVMFVYCVLTPSVMFVYCVLTPSVMFVYCVLTPSVMFIYCVLTPSIMFIYCVLTPSVMFVYCVLTPSVMFVYCVLTPSVMFIYCVLTPSVMFEKSLVDNFRSPSDYLAMWTAYIDYHRRHLDSDSTPSIQPGTCITGSDGGGAELLALFRRARTSLKEGTKTQTAPAIVEEELIKIAWKLTCSWTCHVNSPKPFVTVLAQIYLGSFFL